MKIIFQPFNPLKKSNFQEALELSLFYSRYLLLMLVVHAMTLEHIGGINLLSPLSQLSSLAWSNHFEMNFDQPPVFHRDCSPCVDVSALSSLQVAGLLLWTEKCFKLKSVWWTSCCWTTLDIFWSSTTLITWKRKSVDLDLNEEWWAAKPEQKQLTVKTGK